MQAEDKALVSNGSKLQRFIDLAQKGAKPVALALSFSPPPLSFSPPPLSFSPHLSVSSNPKP